MHLTTALTSAGGQVDCSYHGGSGDSSGGYLCDGGAIEEYGSRGGSCVMKVVGCKEELLPWWRRLRRQ